uniref:Short form D7 salivary protein SD7-1 n=1 Tax=Ochlerotatus triseriatus TaxID=7162 RepID=C6ZQZ1_OCHTR
MIRTLLLLALFSITVSEGKYPQWSFFTVCSNQYYSHDKTNLCKIKRLEFGHHVHGIKDLFDCVFMGYQWQTVAHPRTLQPNTIISDLKANGLNENDARPVVTNCQKTHGSKITALQYFMCLWNNAKTKPGILKWIKIKNENFFKPC